MILIISISEANLSMHKFLFFNPIKNLKKHHRYAYVSDLNPSLVCYGVHGERGPSNEHDFQTQPADAVKVPNICLILILLDA